MNDWLHLIYGGLDPAIAVGLFAVSFLGSFITVALGIGGGALLLAIMASTVPATALIPIHGIIQIGSNFSRVSILFRHIHWKPVSAFAIGSAIGVVLGGVVVVDLPAPVIQIGVGCFVIWNVLSKPPEWLARNPALTGTVSSFLTMFFGASGVFVANFTKSLNLERRAHVATHAAFMTLQHGLKVVAFALLGFAFAPWAFFIVTMIACGFLGTIVGRSVLIRIGDSAFKKALDLVLLLISARLIWSGVTTLWGSDF